MPSSTLVLWETPTRDPKASLQGVSRGVDTGHGTPLPTRLVKSRTALLGGLSSLKLLYHVSECLAATPGDSRRRNCSSCSKVRLLEETWAVTQRPAEEAMFSHRLEITKHKPNTKVLHPSHSSPSLGCDLLDVSISRKLQADSTPSSLASREFTRLTQRRGGSPRAQQVQRP